MKKIILLARFIASYMLLIGLIYIPLTAYSAYAELAEEKKEPPVLVKKEDIKKPIPKPQIAHVNLPKDATVPRMEDVFLSRHGSELTPYERESLKQAKKWQDNGKNTALAAIQGMDGSVRFLFGAKQPTIICAVLQVTDLELQKGEQVNSIHLGDSNRWLIDPAMTGEGDSATPHLIIKPMDVGLETSLIVTTDRRTYNVRLKSMKKSYMPHVTFMYPEHYAAKFQRKREVAQAKRERLTLETGDYLGNLDFEYSVSGNGAKPLRVYNDGVKTVIQMSKDLKKIDAPSLLLLNNGETQMVNYRLQGDRYIVDSLFDKAVLISGVGSKQQKTTIARIARSKK